MKTLVLIQFLVILLFLKSCAGEKGFKIRQFKILCYNFNSTKLRLERCEINAKRGTGGLLNIVLHYKGLKELQCNLKLFYRGTSGRYQPYFVDILMDACDLATRNTSNEIKRRVFTVFRKFDPNFRNGCPLVGPLNISNFDFDMESEKFFPPVIAGSLINLFYKNSFDKINTCRGKFYDVLSSA